MGAQIILGNTFHLWLRPGLDVLQQFGGLHRFEGWSKPILTDSGGFQVWSLGDDAQDQRGGRELRVAGQRRQAVPHARGLACRSRRVLNSDIVMQFDECTPYETDGHVDDRGRGARVDGAEPALGAALPGRVRAAGEPERAVRHRAGRHVREPARGVARRAGRAGPARLRDRRRQRRRAEGGDAAHHGAHAAPPAGRQAALPDGRGHARRPGRGRGRTASTCSTA